MHLEFLIIIRMIRDIWFSLPWWMQTLCGVFLCAWLVQLIYLFSVRMRPLWRMRQDARKCVPVASSLPPLSIVVYAHNQSQALLQNLPVLLDMDYPDFEVIVVDDGSNDNHETENVLRLMDQRSDHFFHTTIAERIRTVSHRKLAMLLGVKAAHNDIVVMTQAQCVPTSSKWLESIGRLFVDSVDAVVGPVVYEHKRGLLNGFYQWDFFDRMLTSMGLTLAVKTYGGWSFNMAFRKEAFYADNNRSIQQHLGVNPGEDDLFLSAIAKKDNITVACSPDAVIVNHTSELGYDWKRERLNRAFTHRFSLTQPRIMCRLDVISRIFCMLSGLALIGLTAWMQSWWVMGIAIFLLVLYLVAYVLIPYFISKRLQVHRYKLLPLAFALYTPLVDWVFNIRTLFRNHQFYVGRID